MLGGVVAQILRINPKPTLYVLVHFARDPRSHESPTAGQVTPQRSRCRHTRLRGDSRRVLRLDMVAFGRGA